MSRYNAHSATAATAAAVALDVRGQAALGSAVVAGVASTAAGFKIVNSGGLPLIYVLELRCSSRDPVVQLRFTGTHYGP